MCIRDSHGNDAPRDEAQDHEQTFGKAIAELPGDGTPKRIDPEEDCTDEPELFVGHAEVRLQRGKHREHRLAVRIVQEIRDPHEGHEQGGLPGGNGGGHFRSTSFALTDCAMTATPVSYTHLRAHE